jgi:phosphate:Na+ symporter
MRHAAVIASEIGALPGERTTAVATEAPEGASEVSGSDAMIEQSMARLDTASRTLRELQRVHRKATLGSVAGGAVSADEAIARVDSVRRLEALARRARRSVEHLVDSKAERPEPA